MLAAAHCEGILGISDLVRAMATSRYISPVTLRLTDLRLGDSGHFVSETNGDGWLDNCALRGGLLVPLSMGVQPPWRPTQGSKETRPRGSTGISTRSIPLIYIGRKCVDISNVEV